MIKGEKNMKKKREKKNNGIFSYVTVFSLLGQYNPRLCFFFTIITFLESQPNHRDKTLTVAAVFTVVEGVLKAVSQGDIRSCVTTTDSSCETFDIPQTIPKRPTM